MSSPSCSKQNGDGEAHRQVEEASTDSTATKQLAQTNTDSHQVHYEETSDIDDPQGEVARSEHWSSGKIKPAFMGLASDADTVQLPNLTHPFNKLKKICLQFGLPTRTEEELKKMQP